MDPNETPLTPTPAEDTRPSQNSQNSQSSQNSQNTRPSPPRRHYSLWELVRHLDNDTPPDVTPADPTGSVLASIRPSAWPD